MGPKQEHLHGWIGAVVVAVVALVVVIGVVWTKARRPQERGIFVLHFF